MDGEYDEYGAYKLRRKSPIAYWGSWGAIALTLITTALGCFDRSSPILGSLLLAAVPVTLFFWYRNRRQNHLELPD